MANDFTNPTKQKLLPISAIAPTGGTQYIRDISPSYWFGPLQPIKPVAPSTYRPRQYAYTPGTNIIWTPKGEDAISFATLRALADSWDLLRIIIETQKDRICKTEFKIQPKIEPGETKAKHKQRMLQDKNVIELNRFLRKPDGFHPFPQWLRMWLEDMIVIDAVALYLERDKQGKIASVLPLAGDTFNRLLTEQGITPPAPSSAYQQVVYGSPACELTADDLIYFMRNERTNRRYGYSPVEQILITISIALRRQEFQLQYYTSGNMPEALCFMPPDVPIDKVKELQDWFDSVLAGDLSKRRRLTFLPGYGAGGTQARVQPNIIFPKEPLLKDEMDEWLAKVACGCIGISPQPFLKMMNRASAQQQQDITEEESLDPWLETIESVLNLMLEAMGYGEKYEAVKPDFREHDVLKQAQADKVYLDTATKTRNQILEALGEDPSDIPEADQLGMLSSTQGWLPLHSGDVMERQQALGTDPETKHRQAVEMAAAKPAPVVATGGKPNGKAKLNGKAKPEKMNYAY